MRWKSMLFVLLAVLVALFSFIRFSPFMEQDNCLDGGGMWLDGECIGRRATG
ncbi:hypothetical protein [Parvibaculum sp.]|jgi:hypothetical protein|uniref:hypothetical protein n=1 Tax=Parvibaculum sp. TaxID=2024848 RepID=UPI002FD907FD